MSNASDSGLSGANVFNVKSEQTALDVVEDIAERHFAIRGKASTLSSERDETFFLQAADRKYVLKIANPAERIEILEFQTKALQHLARKNLPLPLPQVVPVREGETLLVLPIGSSQRIARVLTYLDGQPLHRTMRSEAQLCALGRALALMGQGLADFRPHIPKQDLLWDICNAPALRNLVGEVDPAHRHLVSATFDRYDALAANTVTALRRQVIHNDFNPYNILVASEDPATITGVIDFGDMVEAPLVNDLAVALSYQVDSRAGLGHAATMLRAYNDVWPLEPPEFSALPTLLRTRLAMTVAITEWRARLHPENSAYILRNHPSALAGLKLFADTTDAELAAFFRAEIGDLT